MLSMNNRRPARRAFGRFETLESRLPLAGNVSYIPNFPFSGVATIVGDEFNNNIVLEQSNFAGFYQLRGLNDGPTNQPTLINGSNNPIFIPFADAPSINITLGDGNDQVVVKGVNVTNLDISTGRGNDVINVGDYVPLTTPNAANNQQIINNNLTIRPGTGTDVLRVNYVYGANNIDIQKENNFTTEFIGSLDLQVYVAFTDFFFAANDGDLAVNQANPVASNDQISLGYITTDLACTVSTGVGSDLISYFACRDGNNNRQGAQTAQFFGGTGDDYIALDVNIYENGVTVDAGDGNDTIQFSRAVFVGNNLQTVTLFCGTGNDTLLVGKYYAIVSGQAVLLDSGSSINFLAADLGPGDDTATIVTNIFNRLEVFLGGGTDNAYFGSNLVNFGGAVRIDGDRNAQLTTIVSGFDRVRRFNNTWDAFTINFQQVSIEETVFGPQ